MSNPRFEITGRVHELGHKISWVKERLSSQHHHQPRAELYSRRHGMLESYFPRQTNMERAGRLIGKMKLSSGVADPEVRARAAWPLAAGKKIAEHTCPVALVRGSLVVEVEDLVWQRQLAALHRALLKNLAKVLGEALVTDIDFRPMPAAHRMPPRPATVRTAVAEIAGGTSAAKSAEAIEDPVMEMLYKQSKKSAQRAERSRAARTPEKKESA